MVEGYSTIDTEIAVIKQNPFACVWFQTEDRTPRVVLEANPHYWNISRGPRLKRVVFRNDVGQPDALRLVCDAVGEVDVVTNVAPADAARVRASRHARLVKRKAMRAIVGVINRAGSGNPLNELSARLALNYAVDRDSLVDECLAGYGEAAAGLTPSWTLSRPRRLKPYAYDPKRAAKLWRKSGWQTGRHLTVAAGDEHEEIARFVARNIADALKIKVDVAVFSAEEKVSALRRLAEKKAVPNWDVFIYGWSGQTTDAPPLELHYQFVGRGGALRSGAWNLAFERLYGDFAAQTGPVKQASRAAEIDKVVYEQALALFLCSPQALYAVNKEVNFTPYATTFELAECEVSADHWSLAGGQHQQRQATVHLQSGNQKRRG